eukprot:14255437-Alexandrium_andersonii.AAC.1
MAVVRLLKGESVQDAAWLSRGSLVLRRSLYVVNSALVASIPAEGELPWPILLLFGTHSRKHIFRSKADCSPDVMRRAARSLCTKIKWWWHFTQLGEGDSRNHGVEGKPLVPRPPRSYEGQ